LLKTDGVLWCWGNNTTGQIGNGGTDDQVIPVPVPDIPTVVVVAAGGSHSCAVAEDGIAWCWGSNFYGQLGDGSGLDEVINDKVHPLPAQVVGISGVVSLVSGWNHSCALTADALVACWGSNWDVELGTDTELVFSSSPVVPGTLGSDNISLHTGARHTCAGKGDGSLWCWGYNRWGQLGNGELGVGNGFGGQNLPAQVLGLSAVKSFSGGGSHSCALGPGGGLACWGLNSVGQLGDGEGGSQPTPKAVEGLVDLVDISGGKEFTCAAMGDGQLSCWGQGYGGQLGDGLGLPSKVPTSVLVEGSVSDFDVGAEHACAIDDGGDVYCWGSGSNGKLGNGDDESQSEPVLAMGGALQVSCGGYHTCLVAVDGQAWCWGDRHWGQLGNGAEWLGYSAFPVKPVGLPEVTYVSAGGGHTCAVEQGGQVWCWGKNGKGQVGVSNLDYKQLPFAEGYPVAVVGIDSAASLATGDSHTCVLSTDGSVTCWGDNEEGQLGNGELGVGGFQPVQVAGLEDVQSLCAGANHNCALVANGTVKCWGANDHAQVGAASPGKQLTPQTVAGLSEVASIGCGDRHSCAVLKDGTAMCWGDNRRGQLGYGNAWALLPQPVVGFPEL
jgi:alpha-tubulin suppressor-like RCC1 family protein